MSGAAWLNASATMSKADVSALDISSALCRLAPNAILCAMSDWTASRLDCSRSTCSACRVMNATRGACDGHADDDGPQELVPGTTGGGMRLVRRCDRDDADGVLQGGEGCIEASPVASSSTLARCAVCGVSGPPARNAPRVGCAATKAAMRPARCGARSAVARRREEVFEVAEGLVRARGRRFRPRHQCGGADTALSNASAAKTWNAASDPRRSRTGAWSTRYRCDSWAVSDSAWDALAHPEEGPRQRDKGHDDAHQDDRPVGCVPLPAFSRGRVLGRGDGVGPSAHGDTYRHVRAIS